MMSDEVASKLSGKSNGVNQIKSFVGN